MIGRARGSPQIHRDDRSWQQRRSHSSPPAAAAWGRRLRGGSRPTAFEVAILSSSGKGEALAGELGGLGVTGSNKSNDDLKRLVDGDDGANGAASTCSSTAPATGRARRSSEITDEQWHTGLDIYLLNVIRPTRLVAPVMQAQKGGAIINISTAWAFEPSAMFPTSAVFRAGLAAFTKIFADTYAADNVRMNNVLPGWIDSLPQTEERRDSVPMQRYGTGRGDRRDDRVPGVRGRGLHHRPEHPRRRRADALGLRARGIRIRHSRALVVMRRAACVVRRCGGTTRGASGHTRHAFARRKSPHYVTVPTNFAAAQDGERSAAYARSAPDDFRPARIRNASIDRVGQGDSE